MHKFNRVFMFDIYKKIGYNSINVDKAGGFGYIFITTAKTDKNALSPAMLCWGQTFAPFAGSPPTDDRRRNGASAS